MFERGNGNSLRGHEEEYPCLRGVGESRGGCSVCVHRHTERACARASERASEKERQRHIDRDKGRQRHNICQCRNTKTKKGQAHAHVRARGEMQRIKE